MKQFILTILLMAGLNNLAGAQAKYHSVYLKTTIDGTSTFHDWTMVSEKAKCEASFSNNGAILTGLTSLMYTIDANTLKSDHSGLDKNAYKSLNVEKYPVITFSSNFANIKSTGTNSYSISAKGKLTISGVSKEVWLVGVGTVNPADMSLQITSTVKIKMTDYSVDPPSFMFGAMKTGNDITLKFNLSLKN